MRINFALSGLKFGGGMKILVELADHLSRQGHHISITTPDVRNRSTWKELSHVDLIRAPLQNGLLTRTVRKLHKELCGTSLKENEYMYWDQVSALMEVLPECDVCIATSPTSALAVSLDTKHRAGFSYMQHYEPLIFREPLMKRLAVLSAHLPLHIIANSSWLKSRLVSEQGIPANSIFVQPSSVNTDVFYPRQSDRFKKHTGQKRIVCMGKPHAWKGFNEMLNAMKLVMREEKNVEWFVYAEKDELPRHAEAPYTLITGLFGDALAELLSSADVVVVPSWYESSPLPVLEALACGAALVTTSLGTEDLVKDNETALVVEPREPRAMAQAIVRLLRDEADRARIREAGLETVKTFTWDAATNNLIEHFARTLGQSV